MPGYSAKRPRAVSGKTGTACGLVLHVDFTCAILCDMYAALGRLYETPPVQFSYPDKLKKINKKSVDFSSCFVYINTINRTEHELVKKRARARCKIGAFVADDRICYNLNREEVKAR